MSPHPLERKRTLLRRLVALAAVLTMLPLAFEVELAWEAGVVVRGGLAGFFALCAVAMPHLPFPLFRAVVALVAIVPGPVLLVIAQSHGGSEALAEAMLVVYPLGTAVVLPEERYLPWLVGSINLVVGFAVLGATGSSVGRMAVFGLHCALGTTLAGIGVLRHARLRDQLAQELESATARFSEALAGGAFMRSRDEGQLLNAAAEVFGAHRLLVALLAKEGDDLVLRASALPAEAIRRRLPSPDPLRMPLARLPAVQDAFARRLPSLAPDLRGYLATLFPPAVIGAIAALVPRAGVDVPLFVDGEPFGILSIRGDSISPARVALISLFARHLEAALENLRALRRQEEQLRHLGNLQRELLGRERLAALGEAAAVVAHEVRNPLGAITNAVALLRREPALEPAGVEGVLRMQAEAARLDALVKDLLFLARPIEPTLQPLELSHLVQRVLDGVADDTSRLKVSLEPAPKVLADSTHLTTGLERLVRHALAVSRGRGTVQLRVGSADGQARLSVEYEGEEVPEGGVDRLFEPAFAARSPGTGLTLALVRRVLDMHHASIVALPAAGGRLRLDVRFLAL